MKERTYKIINVIALSIRSILSGINIAFFAITLGIIHLVFMFGNFAVYHFVMDFLKHKEDKHEPERIF